MEQKNKKYLIKLNQYLSVGYKLADKNLCYKYRDRFNIKEEAAFQITRRVMPVIIHLFFEKLLHITNSNKIENFSKKITPLNHSFSTIQELENALHNSKLHFCIEKYLNDNIYQRKIKGNQKQQITLNKNYTTQNNLYIIDRLFLYKFFFKLEIFIYRFIPFLNRIPTLHMSQISPSFYSRGLFTYFFKNIDFNFTSSSSKKIKKERVTFFQNILPKVFFENFVNNFKLKISNINKLEVLFNEFCAKLFPIIFFEDFRENFKKADNIIKQSSKKIILASGNFSSENIFILAAAKNNQFKIIKAQHGGYEGYIDENPVYHEMVYMTADYYLTWGWKSKSKYKNLIKKVKLIPLPSPWLSDRKKLFEKIFKNKKNINSSFLYMPSKLIEFRSLPFGSNNLLKIDNTKSSKIFLKLIKCLEELKYNTTCKFYSPLEYEYYNKLSHFKKNDYKIVKFSDSFDKGLNPDNLKKIDLVIWDLPGTGFLECIACDIPTILFFNQDTMQINDHSKKYFHDLKEVGIFCENIKEFKESLNQFTINNNSWLNDLKRKKAIKNFNNQFALTDSNWKLKWKNKIFCLSEGRI